MLDLAGLSNALAAKTASAESILASIRAGDSRALSGIVWRPDAIVTSEQALPAHDTYTVTLPGGATAAATPAGRDPSTNVAVLRLAQPAHASAIAHASMPRVGALAIAVGAGPIARLAIVAESGPAWHSMAGGRIDALLRLDMRAGRAEEGGPVIDATGALVGMATAGPRGRALVIPAATIDRAVGPLLEHGRIRQGWLGLGLQPVAVPKALAEPAGQAAGLMIASLAAGGPAELAGCVPGDILLDLDGESVMRPRALRRLLGPERIGQPIALRLIRAGAIATLTATVAARPA